MRRFPESLESLMLPPCGRNHRGARVCGFPPLSLRKRLFVRRSGQIDIFTLVYLMARTQRWLANDGTVAVMVILGVMSEEQRDEVR